MLFELFHHVYHRRGLLPDRNVNADQVLALLVDDRIDGHRGLAGLAVADDQFALAAAHRHHGVDRLEAGLHRLRYRLPVNNARGDLLDNVGQLGVDRALAVDRLTKRVDHASDQFGAHRHIQDSSRTFNGIALGDMLVCAKNNGTDRVTFEVEREAEGVLRELEHLALHHVGKAVDAADAVGH